MQLGNSRRAGLGVLGAMTIILISTRSAALAQTWRSVGPDPIAGAYATFGSAQITTPTYNAAGRVTAIGADPTAAHYWEHCAPKSARVLPRKAVLSIERVGFGMPKKENPGSAEMGRQVAVVLYVVAMAAVIVVVDFVFFRNRFWERLTVNIGIVLVFAAFYLRFLRRP